jgi:hypothetical protein
MKTIMVSMADHAWTSQAMHLACAVARNSGMEINLVRMMSVQHLLWLGMELGEVPPTREEYKALRDYQATAEDYGVNLCFETMQCVSLADALVDAADQLDAEMVFATLPENNLTYWRRFQLWMLGRRLAAKHRQLHTLEQPVKGAAWAPSVTVHATK